MKLYGCYTPSHLPLVEQHFLPSAKAEFGNAVIDHRCTPRIDQSVTDGLRIRELNQDCTTGEFDTAGFQATCVRKVEFIIEALHLETEPFIFSDVDVRFYGPVVDDLLKCLGSADMAFQWDGPSGRECTGFMVLRPSGKLRRFWENVRDRMADHDMMDQDAAHSELEFDRVAGTADISKVILPERYWTFGRNNMHWMPGEGVNPPADLLVHHANWTTGVDNKLSLLEAVWRVRNA
jgi:hypothetical protein